MNAVELGKRIRQARERTGISQEGFAELIDKDQRAISEYEHGTRRVSVIELPKLARALGVPILYFFEGDIDISDQDRAILEQFHRLTQPNEQQTALDIIRLLGDAFEHRSKS